MKWIPFAAQILLLTLIILVISTVIIGAAVQTDFETHGSMSRAASIYLQGSGGALVFFLLAPLLAISGALGLLCCRTGRISRLSCFCLIFGLVLPPLLFGLRNWQLI